MVSGCSYWWPDSWWAKDELLILWRFVLDSAVGWLRSYTHAPFVLIVITRWADVRCWKTCNELWSAGFCFSSFYVQTFLRCSLKWRTISMQFHIYSSRNTLISFVYHCSKYLRQINLVPRVSLLCLHCRWEKTNMADITYVSVIWNPCTPHSGLSGAFTFYASESEWSPRFSGTKWVLHFPVPTFQHMVLPLLNNLSLPSVANWLKNPVGSNEINSNINIS